MEQKKKVKPSLFRNNTTGIAFIMLIIFCLAVMLFLSIILPEKEISERENRALAKFPKFTVSSYFAGDFNRGIEDHYSDTFPFRDKFLNVNDKLTKLTSQFSSGGDDAIVVIQTGERDLGGEGAGDAEKAQQEAEEEVTD